MTPERTRSRSSFVSGLPRRIFCAGTCEIYDTITGNRSRTLRVWELLYAVADRFPGVLPTRQGIDVERALKQQSAKEGYEIDRGLFIAHVLADPDR